MRCCDRASCSVKDLDWRTVLSATSTLRPRRAATERMRAAASFSSFSFMTSSILPPPRMTGGAPPVLVPGDIAAMSADSRMKNPADAARLPLGDINDDGNGGRRDVFDD